MKARFYVLLAEGRWIDGAAMSFGMFLGWWWFA